MAIATVALAVEATGNGAGAWAGVRERHWRPPGCSRRCGSHGGAYGRCAAGYLCALRRICVARAWPRHARVGAFGCGMARSDATAALHVITIGSLGTLTLNVMAMTWFEARRSPASTPLPMVAAPLPAPIADAAAAVLAGLRSPNVPIMLLLASLCWSGAFGLLLIVLLRVAPGPHRSRIDRACER